MVEANRTDGNTQNMPPHPKLTRYYAQDGERAAFLGQLFDASATHYDNISRFMSFGSDRAYRRHVLLRSGLAPGMTVLDVACGTGIVAAAARDIVGAEGLVVGLDPSPGMLREACRQGRLTHLLLGRAEALPLAGDRFDLVSMGFALRHVADLRSTFHEILRVLKPGGSLVAIEINRPKSRWSYGLMKIYLKSVVPGLTRLTTLNRSAQSLMDYHWDTIDRCVPPEEILGALVAAGFSQANRQVTLGLFNEYRATKAS